MTVERKDIYGHGCVKDVSFMGHGWVGHGHHSKVSEHALIAHFMEKAHHPNEEARPPLDRQMNTPQSIAYEYLFETMREPNISSISTNDSVAYLIILID